MKMERDILDIIVDKEFHDLTTLEKQELKEFCSTKAEFEELKIAVLGMNAVQFETPQPKAKTKQKLDDLFMQTYPKAPVLWYNSVFLAILPKEKPFYRQPLLQVAALLLVLFLVVPIMNSPVLDVSEKVAKLELDKTDKEADIVIKEDDSNVDLIDDVESEVSGNTIIETNERLDQEESPTLFASREVDVMVSDSIEPCPGLHSLMQTSLKTINDSADSEHPDGVFSGIANERVNYSTDASDTDDLLGLCTVTF